MAHPGTSDRDTVLDAALLPYRERGTRASWWATSRSGAAVNVASVASLVNVPMFATGGITRATTHALAQSLRAALERLPRPPPPDGETIPQRAAAGYRGRIQAADPRHRPLVPALSLIVEPHPLLRAAAFATVLPAPLGELATPPAILALLAADAAAPLARDEAVRGAVRDLLRHGGYKPTGRGKPASEYLVRAAEEGTLGAINLAVDACNAASLHSGLPISVVDTGRARAPFRVAVAPPGSSYVFNASGQEIDLGGLLCLFDADGPCANAVRDAQRTKTQPATRETLSVVWGVAGHEARLAETTRWYRALLEECGAATAEVAPAS